MRERRLVIGSNGENALDPGTVARDRDKPIFAISPSGFFVRYGTIGRPAMTYVDAAGGPSRRTDFR